MKKLLLQRKLMHCYIFKVYYFYDLKSKNNMADLRFLRGQFRFRSRTNLQCLSNLQVTTCNLYLTVLYATIDDSHKINVKLLKVWVL